MGGGGGECPLWFQSSITSLLFKQYLRNFATFTKMGMQNKIPEKYFVKGITCCHGNPIFDAMFIQILPFWYFF